LALGRSESDYSMLDTALMVTMLSVVVIALAIDTAMLVAWLRRR